MASEQEIFTRAVLNGAPPPDKDGAQNALEKIYVFYRDRGVPKKVRDEVTTPSKNLLENGDRVQQADGAENLIALAQGLHK